MKDKIKDSYNQLANDYANRVDVRSYYNTDYERPAMLKEIPASLNGYHVLDAGCAAGWYTEQFIQRGATVTATDLSPEMVEAAKKRVKNEADVRCLDLEQKLPFQDKSFDFVVSSLALHYIEDWSITFQEFHRLLKPGGAFLFSVHHPFMDVQMSEKGDYFSKELIIDIWKREGKSIEVPFYRRSLQAICQEVLKHFSLEKIIEPQPVKELESKDKKAYEKLMKNPHFLIIKGMKQRQ